MRWQDLFGLLEAHPDLWESLTTEKLLGRSEGRPRKPGEWALAYLAYVNSAELEVRRWHQTSTEDLWHRAGFSAVPSYHATYENFLKLEEKEGAFQEAAAKLIQNAVKCSDGKVGFDVHVDGTEAETNSRLVHDCTGSEKATCGHQIVAPTRASSSDAREERHQMATLAPTDDELLGAASEAAADERGLRVKVGKCWYRLSDDEAGIRAYVRNDKLRKFWTGYYNLKAVDHYTGGVLAAYCCSASTQEHRAYPTLYEQLRSNLGDHKPRAIIADKGFSVGAVFEQHTRDGIASVIPWRPFGPVTRKDFLPKYDRHGIPHCKHCGREGIFHRFQGETPGNPEPRLWFRCSQPGGPECNSIQSILCKEDWRLLVPLWRTTPAYQVLRASHTAYENSHHLWRERYGVAGDTKSDRPKRRGLGVQQLRASAALMLEWVTINYRQGWLGNEPLNTQTEQKFTPVQAVSYTKGILKKRAELGLSVASPDDMEQHQEEVAASAETRSVGGTKSVATKGKLKAQAEAEV